MARYIKCALEIAGERLWVGFDFEGVEGDLSEEGYYRADGFTPAQLEEMGVSSWVFVPATAIADGAPN